jgi:peptide chain release factor 1
MIFERLEEMTRRYRELEQFLQDPDIIANQSVYTGYVKEHGVLAKIVPRYLDFKKIQDDREEANAILAQSDDPEMMELASEEIKDLTERSEALLQELKELLVQEESDTRQGLIMEVRAGTGGEEASLFAADLFRMYAKFAENRGWDLEIMSSSPTALGGFKEIIFSVQGRGAFQALRYESGGHRVQRVPETESQGRIHTSACTVAVLPEVEEVEVEIDPRELRIDTFRSSGPGGQSVNKTSSAVRITHVPTGLVVQCQDEKSQHKNKSRAMRILRSRLFDSMEQKRQQERGNLRRRQIGSGDRSERVRTYNYPQNRVTDHRIGQSFYDLENIMIGDLDGVVEALMKYDREQKLKNL